MRPPSHWVVLIVGLAIAFVTWAAWLQFGIDLTHQKVARDAIGASTQSDRKDAPDIENGRAAQSALRPEIIAERGQVGDSFGGLNALLTAVAGALVFWAGYMQNQLLVKTREVAEEERKHRELQQFESLFFQLLKLTSDVTERIEGPPRRKPPSAEVNVVPTTPAHLPSHKGARALNAYAARIVGRTNRVGLGSENPLKTLERLVSAFLEEAYGKHPSAFGPYYRLLYQTFKHVAESGLPERVQVRYANIARGQISEGAVLLLALNGLTQDGHKFAPLIEKFGLLEHLHPQYHSELKQFLLQGYRERAFLGSQERGSFGHEWIPTPLLRANAFAGLESAIRSDADSEEHLSSGYELQ